MDTFKKIRSHTGKNLANRAAAWTSRGGDKNQDAADIPEHERPLKGTLVDDMPDRAPVRRTSEQVDAMANKPAVIALARQLRAELGHEALIDDLMLLSNFAQGVGGVTADQANEAWDSIKRPVLRVAIGGGVNIAVVSVAEAMAHINPALGLVGKAASSFASDFISGRIQDGALTEKLENVVVTQFAKRNGIETEGMPSGAKVALIIGEVAAPLLQAMEQLDTHTAAEGARVVRGARGERASRLFPGDTTIVLRGLKPAEFDALADDVYAGYVAATKFPLRGRYTASAGNSSLTPTAHKGLGLPAEVIARLIGDEGFAAGIGDYLREMPRVKINAGYGKTVREVRGDLSEHLKQAGFDSTIEAVTLNQLEEFVNDTLANLLEARHPGALPQQGQRR